MKIALTICIYRVGLGAWGVEGHIGIQPHGFGSIVARKLSQHIKLHAISPIHGNVRYIDVNSNVRLCLGHVGQIIGRAKIKAPAMRSFYLTKKNPRAKTQRNLAIEIELHARGFGGFGRFGFEDVIPKAGADAKTLIGRFIVMLHVMAL